MAAPAHSVGAAYVRGFELNADVSAGALANAR
jgi:hypothetical protein